MPRKKRNRAEPSRLIELITAAEGRPLTAAEAVVLRDAIAGGETARRSNGGLQNALEQARAELAGALEREGHAQTVRDAIKVELARMHQGEELPSGTLGSLTPGQWLWRLNRATPEMRLATAVGIQRSHEAAMACHLGQHAEQLAEVNGLRAEKLQLHAALSDVLRHFAEKRASVLHPADFVRRPMPLQPAPESLLRWFEVLAGFGEELPEIEQRESTLLRQKPSPEQYDMALYVSEKRRVRADTAEAHAGQLRAALADVLIRLDGNRVRSYLADTSIDSATLAWWRRVLDESGREQPAVVHPDAEQQVSEPQAVDESEWVLRSTPPVPMPTMDRDGRMWLDGKRWPRPSDTKPDKTVDNPSPETASPQASNPAEQDSLVDTAGSAAAPLPRRQRLRPGLIEQMITAARQQTPDVDVQLVQVGTPMQRPRSAPVDIAPDVDTAGQAHGGQQP